LVVKHASNVLQYALGGEKLFLDGCASVGAYLNVFISYEQVSMTIVDKRKRSGIDGPSAHAAFGIGRGGLH
jgi:hypothetical protein